MSSTPKRSQQEESSHTAGTKRPLDEGSVSSAAKFGQTVSHESPQHFEAGGDGRLPKVPRIESRDPDRRSPLTCLYKRPSAVESTPSITSEVRQEVRDHKENKDLKIDHSGSSSSGGRELKHSEHKDGHAEQKAEPQGDKIKDSSRHERESKLDKAVLVDYKSETKNDRDTHAAGGGSQYSMNESREQSHKGKKYSDTTMSALDKWAWQNFPDSRKDQLLSSREEHTFPESGEAVWENKVDAKGEEKLKERERKRKEERKDDKHKDWGDKDKLRTDRKSNFSSTGGTNAERRDSARENRESDKWEREREGAKEKELAKDKEKDHNINRSVKLNEKDALQNENNIASQQETFERAKKDREKDARNMKSEKNFDVDRGRSDKLAGSYDKESDDGCTEGVDGNTERDREVLNRNVQQRKRMLRPRGLLHSNNREDRLKTRTRESEGYQVKLDAPDLVYKPGECMQELTKVWKEFNANRENKNDEKPESWPTLDVRIPAEYITATNRQVRGGQLWGTDVYTDDSDLVAVLMHTGYCKPTTSLPPSAVLELRVTIRVLPPQDSYTSTLRNNVRSRSWGAAIGCSYRVEQCRILKKRGGFIALEPCLTHVSAVEPTIAPVAVERTMTTRAAASHALRQQRFVREVTVQYNLCNEPWLKYSLGMVADKGLKKAAFTSARLKKGEVLYLETHKNRFELCFNGEKALSNGSVGTSHAAEMELQNHSSHDKSHADRDNIVDVFRWARCRRPLPQSVLKSVGVPLPAKELEVLEEGLDWEDIQWSSTSVWISGKEYVLARAHFMNP